MAFTGELVIRFVILRDLRDLVQMKMFEHSVPTYTCSFLIKQAMRRELKMSRLFLINCEVSTTCEEGGTKVSVRFPL